MKIALIMIALLLGVTFIIEPDIVIKGQMMIKDQYGNHIGYTKQDFLDSNKINVYDSRGKRKGHLERDALNPETWIYEKEGR